MTKDQRPLSTDLAAMERELPYPTLRIHRLLRAASDVLGSG